MRIVATDRQVLLSVFVNRIGFGFTVFEGDALIDWGIKDLRKERHANALAVFRFLLEWYKPTALVMREDHGDRTHRGARAQQLLRRMSASARRRGIRVHRVSREAIQKYFSEVDAKNKHEVAREIARQFPELEDRRPRKRRLWEPEEYRMGIFDAVALALTWLDKQGRD